MSSIHLPLLLVLAPEVVLTAGGVAILMLGLIWRGVRVYRPLTFLGMGVAVAAMSASVYPAGWTTLPDGMLAADAFTRFFRLLGIACALFTFVLALPRPRLGNEFPALLLFAALGISLTAGAANLVMLYVGVELLSITSYVLAGLLRDEPRSNEAAIKYFIYGAVASAIMVYGASFLLGLTGTLEFRGIATSLAAQGSGAGTRWIALPAIVLILAGLGFKIAAVPFHQWSPDVYEGAPTPVTAFLSVGPKAAGFAVMMRLFLVALPSLRADWTVLLAVLAVLTMTVGNLVALAQTHMKRLLAYSSIAQAGYMLIGLAALQARGTSTGITGETDGILALLVYLVAYLLTNIGAFAVVQAVEEATGSDALTSYTGLVRRAPLLASALVFYFLSLVGIPPMACFLGKLFIFSAAMQSGLYWLAAVGVVNSVISLAYYFGVVRRMFFVPAAGEEAGLRCADSLRAAVLVTWAGTLGLIAVATPLIRWAQQSVEFLVH